MVHASRYHTPTKLLSCEQVESKLCLSALSFIAHDFAVNEVDGWAVYAADLDNDRDADVLSTAAMGHNIVWYANTDGNGNFGPQQLIAGGANGTSSLLAADLDGDGDADVISASEDEIAWYANTDGKGSFGPRQIITIEVDQVRSIHVADVDGDGDVDVLGANFGPPRIAWYENIDGRGTFGEQNVIARGGALAHSVFAADLDGDGDVDVLSASSARYIGGDVSWYENTDGNGTFGQKRVVSASEAFSVYADDLDGDGDIDVLSAFLTDDKLVWHENTDGRGTFSEERTIIGLPTDGPYAVYTSDIDGDGDRDVLAAFRYDHKIVWYEQSPAEVLAGDANGDFQFDQHDIIQVLQAGKYLTKQPATFEEGDWNRDGVFDQMDIVAALQTGLYLQGPYAAHAVDAVFGQA